MTPPKVQTTLAPFQAPVQRQAPAPLHDDAAYVWRCVYPWASQLTRLIVLASGLADDVTLDLHPTQGLTIRQVETTQVAMTELCMQPDAWLVWQLGGVPHSVTLFAEQVKRLDKLSRQDHVIVLYQTRDTADMVRVRLYSDTSDRVFSLHCNNMGRADVPILPWRDWPYAGHATLPAAAFAEEVTACVESKSTYVRLGVRPPDRLEFTTYTDTSQNGAQAYASEVPCTTMHSAPASVDACRYAVLFLKEFAVFRDVAAVVDVKWASPGRPLVLAYHVCPPAKAGPGGGQVVGMLTAMLMDRELD